MKQGEKRWQWSERKVEFFTNLHKIILHSAMPRVEIVDSPGLKLRLMTCKMCAKPYWLTDQHENLDLCVICAPKWDAFKNDRPENS